MDRTVAALHVPEASSALMQIKPILQTIAAGRLDTSVPLP